MSASDDYNLCLYIGLGYGHCIPAWIPHCKKFIGFEPNPEQFNHIQEFANTSTYKDKIKLFNYAASDMEGTHEFFITANTVSSSLYEPTGENKAIGAHRRVKVKTVNLYNFLEEYDWTDFLGTKNIEHIDLYVSDTQGHDLTIIKTIEPYLRDKRISIIQCEANHNNKSDYKSAKNDLKDWRQYSPLTDNYDLTADTTVHSSVELDAVWRAKGDTLKRPSVGF